MIKTFDIALEEQRPVDPQNSFAIYRGDNVQFNFTFLKNGEALEIPSGTILRVFAKKIEKNGIVDVNDNPVFAGEWTDSTSATFNSSLTAGDAGMYLMSVMLVSSDDNLITSQAIYFEIKENGYAGRYQPSADYRDEVLNAKQDSINARNEAEDFVQQASEYAYTAETSASEASTSESNAFNFAESSRLYSENANTAESNALQYSQQAEEFKEQAEDFKEQTEDFRDETLVARNEAIFAKEQAQEISDPEGWRVNTRSMINALQQTKSNIGEFWFECGALTTTNKMPLDTPFSCVWTMAMTQDEFVQHKTNSPALIGTENYFGKPATYQGWSICRKTSSDTHITFGASGIDTTNGYIYNDAKILNYLDGNTHVWAVVYNGNAILLYVDSNLLSSINATFNVSQSRLPLQIGQFTVVSNQSDGVWGRFSRIKYFNFDMSDVNAPYTIADYMAGKEESPFINTLLSLDDYSFNGKIADVSGNNNDATITGDVVGTKDKSIEKMYQAFASKIGNVTE